MYIDSQQREINDTKALLSMQNTGLLNETTSQFQFKDEKQAMEDLNEAIDSLFILDKKALEIAILQLPLHEVLGVPKAWLDESDLNDPFLDESSDSEEEKELVYTGFCNIIDVKDEEDLNDCIALNQGPTIATTLKEIDTSTTDASISSVSKSLEDNLKDLKTKKDSQQTEKKELEDWLNDVLG